MRAIAVNSWGGREQLALVDVEPPPFTPDGVLVRVRAAGLNPVDWKIREGKMAGAFPFQFPVILGWDVAGVVEKAGPAVTEFKPGDEVYGYCRRHHLQFGTYAEYVSVPEDFLAPKPAELSFEEAGALPLAGLTAHQGLEKLALRGGETLYVAGGAGGVGHFVIQLAVARGARVIASGSPDNHDFLRSLGAEPVEHDDVPEAVDAAFDLFGGDVRERSFGALRSGGRLVTIASPPPERSDIEWHYVFVRPSGEQLRELGRLVAGGQLRAHVSRAYPLSDAAAAMEELEGGHVRGKLVLTV
jgi:NADPH:quinone reductase-like Zn-dependent oxidoreductase